MTGLEIIKLVVEGGAMVLLAAVLYGVFRLARDLGPGFLAAWNAQTAAIVANTAKLDQVLAAVSDTRARASEASTDVAELRGALATGQHQAVTVERPESEPRRRRP